MRVLVCGGRDFKDAQRVFQELDARNNNSPILTLIEGDATGADRHARHWALSHGIPCITIQPAWAYYGKRAGPIRNEWMIKYGQPDCVIAFPGGHGTASMVKLARKHDIPVVTAE